MHGACSVCARPSTHSAGYGFVVSVGRVGRGVLRRTERQVAHCSRACGLYSLRDCRSQCSEHHIHYPLGRLDVSADNGARIPGVQNGVLIDFDFDGSERPRVKRRVFARETLKTVKHRGGRYAHGSVKASSDLFRTSPEIHDRRAPAYSYFHLYRYVPCSRSVVFKVVHKDVITVRYFLYGVSHKPLSVVKKPGSGKVYFLKRILFKKFPHPLLSGVKRGYLGPKIPLSFLMIPG